MVRSSSEFCDFSIESQKFVLSQKSSSVPECSDPFLALFPHRFDFLYADYPKVGQTPNWQTESRYPLSDRLTRQAERLYGVRFATETRYCLLDIDRDSCYHPDQDPWAIDRIVQALEPLGLVSYVGCTSSQSGGIHLYFPFEIAQRSWELAEAIDISLSASGFQIAAGQLEIFPNRKPYRTEGNQGLFNGHRLPLQIGSYLLNQDFQPIWTNETIFIERWQFCTNKNAPDQLRLKRLLKQRQRSLPRLSGKADKFLADLNAEIDPGWIGSGQTNYLLGRIAIRTYVFHPILSGEPALTGQPLVDEIVKIARSLPGYEEWCNHQSDIEQRAREWARSVENSHYFPYGLPEGKYKSKQRITQPESNPNAEETPKVDWNDRQAKAARARIEQAVRELEQTDQLPEGTTARFQILTKYGISGRSLYKNRDLWHPDSVCNRTSNSTSSPAENSVNNSEDNSQENTENSVVNSVDKLEDQPKNNINQVNQPISQEPKTQENNEQKKYRRLGVQHQNQPNLLSRSGAKARFGAVFDDLRLMNFLRVGGNSLLTDKFQVNGDDLIGSGFAASHLVAVDLVIDLVIDLVVDLVVDLVGFYATLRQPLVACSECFSGVFLLYQR